jgi:hypothetical protein
MVGIRNPKVHVAKAIVPRVGLLGDGGNFKRGGLMGGLWVIGVKGIVAPQSLLLPGHQVSSFALLYIPDMTGHHRSKAMEPTDHGWKL